VSHLGERIAGPWSEDIVYGHTDGTDLVARLYHPGGPGPFPAVVEVHGGAWDGLSYTSDEVLNQRLAEQGILVAAIEFRRPPAGAYPNSVRDVVTAVNWMDEHRGDLGFSAQLGLVGNSSGGHLAMLASLCPDDPRFSPRWLAHGRPDARVDFVVLCWAVVDPVARYLWARQMRIDRLIAKHDRYWGDADAMTDGSPMVVVEGGTYTHLPRVLALQGSTDDNLPPGMIDEFARAYRRVGGQIDVIVFDGQGHNFVTREPDSPASRDAGRMIIDFVCGQGGLRTL
jgi:acetyl esterase